MDQTELLGMLRAETLPKLGEARAALDTALARNELDALKPVRELCHRVAGTGALAGQPGLSRLGHLGEGLALLALEGEARLGERLGTLLGRVLAGIEAELTPAPAAPQAETSPTAVFEAPKKGVIALLSEETVSRKLLTRVLADAGFEVTRVELGAPWPASADAAVIDVPADESLTPKLEAALTAATTARLGVILTGKPDSAAARALAPRASQLLVKPVEPEALEATARTLVARRRLAAAARAKAPTAQLAAPPREQLQRLTVLIVDDSRVIRGVVREALAEVGLRALEAEDGAEALRVFDAERPDAVISDVQMPGLDGAELTRLLRERGGEKRLPIVVLSALDDEASRRAGLSAGADAYLVKSVIDGPALLEALRKAGLPLPPR
jgi:DNA-binding response OmpR family regulator